MPLEITTAELADARGMYLGASPWFEVRQERVNDFADATDDHEWIHVDGDRAAKSLLGGTIAHGYLTLALVPALLRSLLRITDHVRGMNYGLEQVRFTAPVRVGSRIRLVASIPKSSLREDGGVLYHVSLRVEVEGQDRPAMVGESIYLAYAGDVQD